MNAEDIQKSINEINDDDRVISLEDIDPEMPAMQVE